VAAMKTELVELIESITQDPQRQQELMEDWAAGDLGVDELQWLAQQREAVEFKKGDVVRYWGGSVGSWVQHGRKARGVVQEIEVFYSETPISVKIEPEHRAAGRFDYDVICVFPSGIGLHDSLEVVDGSNVEVW